MPARAYWQGQIRLALVSIPIQVFSATKSAARVRFNQIHKESGKRIRYEKTVPGVGAVEPDEIVKGYEVEKGKYVLLENEEIDGVKLEAKRTIDLVQFVDADEIDSFYVDKPYYVAPDEDEVAGEAYVVLRDALAKTGKVGLGQIVARGQASIVALRASGKGLVIETLRYADELQKPDAFFADVPDVEPEEELLSLATQLIEGKAKPFDPKVFKNQYDLALRELIAAKLENRRPHEIDEPELGGKVIDLMEALKASVGSPKGARKRSTRAAAQKSSTPKKTGAAKSKTKTAAKATGKAKSTSRTTKSRSSRAA